MASWRRMGLDSTRLVLTEDSARGAQCQAPLQSHLNPNLVVPLEFWFSFVCVINQRLCANPG